MYLDLLPSAGCCGTRGKECQQCRERVLRHCDKDIFKKCCLCPSGVLQHRQELHS